MESESVVEVAEDSAEDEAECHGEQSILECFPKGDPAEYPAGSGNGKRGEEGDFALAHAKQRTLIVGVLDPEVVFNNPPLAPRTRTSWPVKNDFFGPQIKRAAATGNHQKNQETTEHGRCRSFGITAEASGIWRRT